MRLRIQGLLVLTLMMASDWAYAQVVTWELAGQVASASSSPPFFPSAVTGDQFRVLVTFDTDATLIASDTTGTYAPGARYRYDPSSLRFSVFVGASAPVNFEYEPAASGSPGFIYLLDNTGYVSGGVPWDGITFALIFSNNNVEVAASMRGANTDIFDGSTLPASPDPRLAEQDQRFIQIRAVDQSSGASAFLAGVIDSVRVFVEPEQLLSDLIASVLELNIVGGIGSALDHKLQNALDALDRAQAGDTASATSMLHAFMQSVEAQRGKKLTDAQADELIASAQAIIDALSQK